MRWSERERRWVAALAAALLAVAALVFRRPVADALLAAGEAVRQLGAWGPVALVAVMTLGIPLCLPTAPFLLAAGVLFGPGAGFAYATAGVVLGGSLSFLLARKLLRAPIEKRLSSHRAYRVIDRTLASEGLRGVALVRLTPALPAWTINYALGLSHVAWRDYWLSTIAILPGLGLYALAGAGLGDLAAVESGGELPRGPIYYALLGLGVAATLAASLVLGRRARRIVAAREDEA